MSMDPSRLPGRRPTPPAPPPAPPPAAPAQVQGEAFTGLDPLTRSLIEAAPLVPSAPAPSPTAVPPTAPPTQAPPAPARRGLKQPAVLVALGGSLAAGLLVLTGAVKHRRSGDPAPAAQGTRVATPNPAPILPAATPAPAATWLVAGGHA
ncbi:hypothetical protein [Deinococcus sp. YIM 77859]|uniref:hypothetical protein n=1 Tax=Deinococcus sp. YIM 77859 TaxID=1540221 RepID=UPI000552D036|nr:hypothetical protein [Deinococcus sp. YIM 77859]